MRKWNSWHRFQMQERFTCISHYTMLSYIQLFLLCAWPFAPLQVWVTAMYCNQTKLLVCILVVSFSAWHKILKTIKSMSKQVTEIQDVFAIGQPAHIFLHLFLGLLAIAISTSIAFCCLGSQCVTLHWLCLPAILGIGKWEALLKVLCGHYHLYLYGKFLVDKMSGALSVYANPSSHKLNVQALCCVHIVHSIYLYSLFRLRSCSNSNWSLKKATLAFWRWSTQSQRMEEPTCLMGFWWISIKLRL